MMVGPSSSPPGALRCQPAAEYAGLTGRTRDRQVEAVGGTARRGDGDEGSGGTEAVDATAQVRRRALASVGLAAPGHLKEGGGRVETSARRRARGDPECSYPSATYIYCWDFSILSAKEARRDVLLQLAVWALPRWGLDTRAVVPV